MEVFDVDQSELVWTLVDQISSMVELNKKLEESNTEKDAEIAKLIEEVGKLTAQVAELTEKMSGKNSFTTRTIQRDIAYLQNHDIIKREGGRKEGRWVVLKYNKSNN